MRLNVTGGYLSMSGTSRISADGQTTNDVGGGGAGGSVLIACSQLIGSSSTVIRANGGVGGNSSKTVSNGGKWGGGGGGGRVAVYAANIAGFYGTIQARSGGFSTYVAASGYHLGTVYLDLPLIGSMKYTDKSVVGASSKTYTLDLKFNVSKVQQHMDDLTSLS